MNNVIMLIMAILLRTFLGRHVYTLQNVPDVQFMNKRHPFSKLELFQIILRELEKQVFPGYEMEQRKFQQESCFSITVAATRERDAVHESLGILLNWQSSSNNFSPFERREVGSSQRATRQVASNHHGCCEGAL
uniref:Uncharacterized protein n=1 Tax=Micrurus spixii TaxID=129469 RepID=A0A2D4M6W3_9SAUR